MSFPLPIQSYLSPSFSLGFRKMDCFIGLVFRLYPAVTNTGFKIDEGKKGTTNFKGGTRAIASVCVGRDNKISLWLDKGAPFV